MAISDEFQLPASAQADLPPELSQDFFSTLDESFRTQEKRSLERLLEEQESRGLLHSGETQKGIMEQVLGPSLQRRREALLPIAMEGAKTTGARRFQREGESQGFERQRQFAAEEQERQLARMERQRQIQESIMRLADWLGEAAPSGDLFSKTLTQGFAQQIPGMLLGGGKKVIGGWGSPGGVQ